MTFLIRQDLSINITDHDSWFIFQPSGSFHFSFKDSQVASKWVINNSTGGERQRSRRNREKIRYGNRDVEIKGERKNLIRIQLSQ